MGTTVEEVLDKLKELAASYEKAAAKDLSGWHNWLRSEARGFKDSIKYVELAVAELGRKNGPL